jgi:transcriptional regulator with XRE-family HTH domain
LALWGEGDGLALTGRFLLAGCPLTMKTMGETVRGLREKKGISLRKLSRLVGLSPSFISDLEIGRRYPKAEGLEAIANALGVPASELAELDHRSSVEDLKRLLVKDPAWGPVFRRLYSAGIGGSLTPADLMKKIPGS